MIRFFVSPSDISGGSIRLCAEDAVHIHSLRLRPGELFTVCDGEGVDYICRLGKRSALRRELRGERGVRGVDSGERGGRDGGGSRRARRDSGEDREDWKAGDGNAARRARRESGAEREERRAEDRGAIAEIVETRPSLGEPSVACGVYIAFSKGDRLDYAVQKSVELGARDIVLFPSDRCVSIPDDIPKKIARLQRIALETAKQCGRGRVPEVTAAGSFSAAVEQAARAGLPMFFYECENELHLKQVLERRGGGYSEFGIRNLELQNLNTVSIVTGPEGGFEPYEAELAQSMGLIAVSLGPRILRCETAPVVALAALMLYTDNL